MASIQGLKGATNYANIYNQDPNCGIVDVDRDGVLRGLGKSSETTGI